MLRTWERSNLTPLVRNVGKVSVNCENCGLPFEKYACWAKRVANHFCSRECCGEWKQEKVAATCIVCGSIFWGTRTYVSKVHTCGPACSKQRRSADTTASNARRAAARPMVEETAMSYRFEVSGATKAEAAEEVRRVLANLSTADLVRDAVGIAAGALIGALTKPAKSQKVCASISGSHAWTGISDVTNATLQINAWIGPK